MNGCFRYQTEIDISSFVDEYVERINLAIDEKVLEKVEDDLAAYGYVKVVRCKDCIYYEPPSMGHSDRPACRRLIINGAIYVKPDGFCSWGEHRLAGDPNDGD